MREILAKKRWLQILVLATAYVFVGRLGLLLAIPPGYASVVWPAAGIALAGLLLGGRRVWPGVWLGSFFVNVLAPLDLSTPWMAARSVLIAALLGLGASFQAVAGAALVRRWSSDDHLMDDHRDVLRLLFWGGPVACLISATWSVCTLFFLHGIVARDIPLQWATWWVGDTLGALTFAPLVLLWAEPFQVWRRRWLSVTLPLLATFSLSVFLFFYVSHRESDALRTAFDDRARTLASAVRTSCDNHLEVLLSLESLFVSDQRVTQEEFHRFVGVALNRHPGIRGLSWNPRVTAADRARFEAGTGLQIRQRAGRSLVPAPSRAEYVVVQYIEPVTGAGVRALGLDVAAESVRRDALEKARDTGKIAATGPITLVSEGGEEPSILLFAPVYGLGEVPPTVEERREQIRGYATGAFRLDLLVEKAIGNLPRDGLTVALFDRQEARNNGTLYSDAKWEQRGKESGDPARSESFQFGQRPWEIQVAATHTYLDSYRSWRSWLILVCGFLFTGLLGAFLLVVSSRTAKVEKLVVRRTAELQNELQERMRAEGVVRLSEARNRALLEHMIGGMLTFDEESRIESVNPAAESMLGYFEEELIGQSLALLISDAPANAQEAFLRKAHRAAIGRLTEWRGRRKNGETFPVEAALFEFEAPEGRRFACNFQDISERREVDRLKSEFVATVSHELRTPLTSIRGSLGLLAAGVLGELSPRVKDIVSLAERNAIRLTALINDILDFERLESGRVEMQMADVGLQPLLEQSLDAVRPMSDERRIALVCASTGLRLRADATRIVQVLVNLLSNAIKFSPPGREVRVWAEERDGVWVRVLVEDRGLGIPDVHHQKIFERFAQVETSDKRVQGGTGLGLAICKAIVEHHGGRIGVESEPGTGSTFWFDLPRASA